MNDEENRLYYLGYINGWLESIARVNDKVDNGYDFYLLPILKDSRSISNVLDSYLENVCEFYEIEEIVNPKKHITSELQERWIFDFLSKSCNPPYLKDENRSFYFADNEFRSEFINEFITSLFFITKPNKCFRLVMKNIKRFYAIDWLDIIFENDDYLYKLHLSYSD